MTLSVDLELEQRINLPGMCPMDRFILVAPRGKKFEGASPSERLDAAFRSLEHPILCHVAFRLARDPVKRRVVAAVSATPIFERGRLVNHLPVTAPRPIIGTFLLTMDEATRKAKVGPHATVMIDGDHRSLGIGRYALSQLIIWAKAMGWDDVEILPGTLGPGDAVEAENVERRDRFYRNAGFTVTYSDAVERSSGKFRADSIHQLKTDWPTSRIAEVTPFDIAHFFERIRRDRVNEEPRIRNLNAEVQRLRNAKGRSDRRSFWALLILLATCIALISALSHATR